MLFERETEEGYPLIILARTGNPAADARLHDGIMTVIVCEADMDLVNDQGMPQHTDRIYPIEDMLAEALSALNVGAFHIASITGNGQRRLVYSHVTNVDFAALLKPLNVEGYSLQHKAIADRSVTVALITPTALDRQLDGDRQVIANLEKNGDDGLIPRKTDFWFYGQKAELSDLAAHLAPYGYSVDHWLDDPAGVVLTREIPVDIQIFREITPILIEAAERHVVQYDGWETFVVNPDPRAVPKPKSLLGKIFGGKKS